MARNWVELSEGLITALDNTDGGVQQTTTDLYLLGNEANTQLEAFLVYFNASGSNASNNFCLKNNVNGAIIPASFQKNVSIGKLKAFFEKTGHPLCFDFTSSYIVPLFFDVDCRACKNGTCQSPIAFELVRCLYDEICHIIESVIPMTEISGKGVVFKKEMHCNLHIYFSISVSIILFEKLRQQLLVKVSSRFTERYLFDDIVCLDLPFSAKLPGDIYLPFIFNSETYEKLIVTPQQTFFDLSLSVVSSITFERDTLLGRFCMQRNYPLSEWNHTDEQFHYLVTPIRLTVKENTRIPLFIMNVRLSNAPFTNCAYPLLQSFMNDLNDDVRVRICVLDSAILAKLPTTAHHSAVQKIMLTLATKFAKITYAKKDILPQSHFSYLLRSLVWNSCSYTFYLIISIIAYVIRNLPVQFQGLNNTKHKSAVIDVLRAIANSQHSPEQLLYNLDIVAKFDIYNRIEVAFRHPERWFKDITQKIHLQKYASHVAYITSTMTIYESLADVRKALTVLCELTFPIFRYEQDSSLFYYYSEGLYHEIKEPHLLLKNSVRLKCLNLSMTQLLETLYSGGLLSEELYKKISANSEVFSTCWITYLSSCPLLKPSFNMYEYFIATSHGVFNTLTGLYMCCTQQLFMRTQKKFGVMSLNPSSDMSILNRKILASRDFYDDVVDVVVKQQTTLYYLAVVIPGFLLLSGTLFVKDEEDEILKKLVSIIMQDECPNNEIKLYYTFPLWQYHQLDVEFIMKVAILLHKNFTCFGSFCVADVVTMANTNIEFPIAASSFNYAEIHGVDEFVKRLVSMYGATFKPKLFALSIFLILIDHCNGNDYLKTALGISPINCNVTIAPSFTLSQAARNTHFVLAPFQRDDFTVTAALNFERAINILLPQHIGIFSDALINVLTAFSSSFHYDCVCLNDFLSILSMLFYPNNDRKFLTLLIGNPNCGKTTIQNYLHAIHTTSTFSMESVVQTSTGSGPAPNVIQIHSCYLFNIVELKIMSSEFIKTITSGDVVHHRQLYHSDFKELKSLAFPIAACNTIPRIFGADEAVRVRLAPFVFNVRFVDGLGDMEDNTLLFDVKNSLLKTNSFHIENISVELANILYAQFCANRDVCGVVHPKISKANKNSQLAIMNILRKNNFIYDLLLKANIVFKDGLSISFDTLERVMRVEIENYNLNCVGKRKLVWFGVLESMKNLFINYLSFTEDSFNGFGLEVAGDVLTEVTLQRVTDDRILKTISIKRYLLCQKGIAKNNLDTEFMRLKERYADDFDSEVDGFRNLCLPQP